MSKKTIGLRKNLGVWAKTQPVRSVVDLSVSFFKRNKWGLYSKSPTFVNFRKKREGERNRWDEVIVYYEGHSAWSAKASWGDMWQKSDPGNKDSSYRSLPESKWTKEKWLALLQKMIDGFESKGALDETDS